jgi:hypothetical protein
MLSPRYVLILAVAFAGIATPALAQTNTYRILATSRTSTMQDEMREAGDAGFRFVAAMGGETALGGREVVVLMEKVPESTARYEYLVLATNRTSTLQKELQQASDAGYEVVGQTVFQSTFGGKETAALLQRSSGASETVRYEYKLAATSRTSTMQKELQELADQGFEATGLTVGKTALGGDELVVITRRKAQ